MKTFSSIKTITEFKLETLNDGAISIIHGQNSNDSLLSMSSLKIHKELQWLIKFFLE